jgi:hypothetical protein
MVYGPETDGVNVKISSCPGVENPQELEGGLYAPNPLLMTMGVDTPQADIEFITVHGLYGAVHVKFNVNAPVAEPNPCTKI